MKRSLFHLLLTLFLGFGLLSTAGAETTRVLMKTSLGDIELELDGDKAPKSVENFLRYADEGFYNGTLFHRVINSFMIQGGGFTPDMERKNNHDPIKNEAKNGLKNIRGSIAMARTNLPHSATSQFFINHGDNSALDYPSRDGWGYAVFGQVAHGMETVDRIADVYTVTHANGMRNVPETAVIIENVSRITTDK